jgi:hypothetical protein
MPQSNPSNLILYFSKQGYFFKRNFLIKKLEEQLCKDRNLKRYHFIF